MRTVGLISVERLARRLDGADTRVCDVRFYLGDHDQGRREYDEGHVPGAVFVDLHTELAGASGGGRHPLPPVEQFGDLLGRIGVSPETFVVTYDSVGGAIASRLWWMLRSVGHERVAVLDGGFPAWVGAGEPVTAVVPEPAAVRHPVPTSWTRVVDADRVADELDRGSSTVIDARAGERFRGETEPIDPRAGHIPGAINIFHGDNLDTNGFHRSHEALRSRFARVGAAPIVYCGSGVTACHDLLAMSVAGIDDAVLYPGSWSDWSSDPTRPVATGQ